MNATELMIGNFVRCGESSCQGHRVDFVNEADGEVGVDGEILDLDMVYPIPLTIEILEKNGFKEYNGYGYASNKGYCFEGFYINYDFTTRIANIDYKFNYVHELQHALKLCGIEKEIVL